MTTQAHKEGFEAGMALQSQCDTLRGELQSMARFRQFGLEYEEKTALLQRLDRLFSLHCSQEGLELSRFGRLL